MKKLYEEPRVEIIKLIELEAIADDVGVGGDGIGTSEDVEDFPF